MVTRVRRKHVSGSSRIPVFHLESGPLQWESMSEAKTAIQTSQAPAAIGPYSQAIRIGNFVFTSGQVAIDPATGQLVAGGIEAQTHRVLQNLQAVLAAAGLDFSRVVKTTVFLKDMAHFAAMNAIYAEYLQTNSSPAPARSTVEVARLPKDALVEIEVVACEA